MTKEFVILFAFAAICSAFTNTQTFWKEFPVAMSKNGEFLVMKNEDNTTLAVTVTKFNPNNSDFDVYSTQSIPSWSTVILLSETGETMLMLDQTNEQLSILTHESAQSTWQVIQTTPFPTKKYLWGYHISYNAQWLFALGQGEPIYSGVIDVYKFNKTITSYSYIQTLNDPNDKSYDDFGSSVEVSYDGSLLAIGADNENGPGVILLYQLNSSGMWETFQTLEPPPGYEYNTYNAFLGSDISLGNADGSFIVAGMFGWYRSSGGVAIYERQGSTWEVTEILTPPAGTIGYDLDYGFSVCVSDDTKTILVGAPSAYKSVSDWEGTVFEYILGENSTYTLQNELAHPLLGADIAKIAGGYGTYLSCSRSLDMFFTFGEVLIYKPNIPFYTVLDPCFIYTS